MEKACRTPRSARRLTAAEVDAFAPTVHDFLNVEVKARCNRIDEVRRILLEAGAEGRGIDRQADTYFETPRGRLKTREGTIENALIAYERPDIRGARPSDVKLAELSRDAAETTRVILESVLPVKVRVAKRREILYLGNVKFHLDDVEGLGSFVEIEAQSRNGVPDRRTLEAQAVEWRARLGLRVEDLEERSYSDMLFE